MSGVASVLSDTPKVADKANFAWGVVIGFLSLVFGEYWFLFAGFLFLNIADWISGNYKAHVNKKISSVSGAAGIFKKVWYWVVIAIAFFISHTFAQMGDILQIDLSFVNAFGWLTLAMYLVNEIRSVLENLIEVGVEVPNFLVKGLDVTRKMMDTKSGGDEK